MPSDVWLYIPTSMKGNVTKEEFGGRWKEDEKQGAKKPIREI